MRPLTDDETVMVFEKLAKYIGDNIKFLVDRADGKYFLRLHRDRVYYVEASVLKAAATIPHKRLKAFGTCIGKLTHSNKFRLRITALDALAPYAKNKVWLKPQGEQAFLYGNNALKSFVGRMTDSIAKYDGVLVFSMSDVPLGFGVAAFSTADATQTDATAIVVFHQADVGEYLRDEDAL